MSDKLNQTQYLKLLAFHLKFCEIHKIYMGQEKFTLSVGQKQEICPLVGIKNAIQATVWS